MCLSEILCTILWFIYHLVWCDRQGISTVGTPHRRWPGVVFVYHKVMYTKALPITNSRSFHLELKKWSVWNLPLSISDRISRCLWRSCRLGTPDRYPVRYWEGKILDWLLLLFCMKRYVVCDRLRFCAYHLVVYQDYSQRRSMWGPNDANPLLTAPK